MKSISFFILISLLLSITFSPKTYAKGNNRRVVLIALDGISVEGFKKANMPNLDKLMAEGILSTSTRNVMPSVTLPNWTSHLTGSGPEQHGIVDNGWQINKFILPSIEKDAKGYYPSVFKVLKDQVPEVKTAFYYNWANLIYPYNQDYFDDVSFEENDGYVKNYQKAFDFIVENRKKPTVVFLYSVHTDHAGHKYGWMSAEFIKAMEDADVQIGDFLQKLKTAGMYDDTYFMFLSDHGGIENGHGGVSLSEMDVPWGITGPKIDKDRILKEPNNTVNTAAVILHLFKCKKPNAWTGTVPASIFKR